MEKKKIPKNESGGISRRDFLKDAGLLIGGTAIGSTVLLAACGGGETTETVTKTTTVSGPTVTVTPPAEALEGLVTLKVNDEQHVLQVEAEWTLRDVLREKLGLTSIKDMCNGYGACGSCTAIVDGRPVLTCMILAIECDGVEIETAEGIADSKHPLIEAYIANSCMQCGYCTPGFVCTAKALLDKNPNPTESEIMKALAGNLCRCGTYPQHPKAVLAAANVMKGGK